MVTQCCEAHLHITIELVEPNPKNVFVGRETLVLGVHDAVLTFNEGNIGRIKVLKELGIKDCGKYTVSTLKSLDEVRMRKADLKAESMTKEARIKKRRQLLGEEEEMDGSYCPGGF
ncbi:hypothetical protein J6590_023375 [Homalodisca vitripennis]|nr:hypothetical protein J6590_023375 [Homalodisca vitripennis]